MKKQLCEELGIAARNEHERDSALMGVNIIKRVQIITGGHAFQALHALSQEGKKFPRRCDPQTWEELLEMSDQQMRLAIA